MMMCKKKKLLRQGFVNEKIGCTVFNPQLSHMCAKFQPYLEIKDHLFMNIACTYYSERVKGR